VTFEEIENLLRSFRKIYLSVDRDEIGKSLADLKSAAVAKGDEIAAKHAWCLESVNDVQRAYISAFAHAKLGEFFDAWCNLESAEISLIHLRPHLEESFAEYFLDWIDLYVSRYQQLFPYRLFSSIGVIVKRRECSIWGAKVGLRRGCAHRKGEIYSGEMCCDIICESELLEISMVEHPVNKYTVPFDAAGEGHNDWIDNYDYTQLAFIIDRVVSPFDEWEMTFTTRRASRDEYLDYSESAECPCGSKIKYADCCSGKNWFDVPHANVSFRKKLPENRPYLVRGHGPGVKGRLTRRSGDNRFWTRYCGLPRKTQVGGKGEYSHPCL